MNREAYTYAKHKAQTIKGNQTGTFHVLSGSLVTYQCGEAADAPLLKFSHYNAK